MIRRRGPDDARGRSVAPGWRRLFRLPRVLPRAIERDLDDELAFHLAMRVAKLRSQGTPEAEAAAAALARFGDAQRVRSECLIIDRQYVREVRLMEWIASVAADLRYAARTLRRAPAFTLIAVLTIAIGIGATSAMFSLVDGILLRPLPYPHADRLISFRQSYPEKGLSSWTLSQENAAMYRDRATAFASFAAYTRRGVTLGGQQPMRLDAERTTGEFFSVLGVPPLLGRTYTNADDTPRTNDVAVLGFGFWKSHFGGDRNIIGSVIDIDGAPVRVIGVMPRDFAFPRADVQLYLPLGLDPGRRFGWFLTGVARLRDGVTIAQAHQQTAQLFRQWASTLPGLLPAGTTPEHTGMTTVVVPLQQTVVGDARRPLLVLQAAVILVLLIGVANVATLQSSRAAGRAREIALRGALGASTGRVGRQLLTESVALALAGGVGGVLLAMVAVHGFTHSSIAALPRLAGVSVDARVLAFTLVIAVSCGLLFGLAPLVYAARHRGARALASGDRGSAHAGARRLNNALVVAQLALSVTLLVSAGLVLASFQHLLDTDVGFDPANVTIVTAPMPAVQYADASTVLPFVDASLSRIRALPGIESAAIAALTPYGGSVNTDGYIVEGHAPPAATVTEKQVSSDDITPGYFRTMRIALLRGRDFTPADRRGTLPVTIIDETLAREYWPSLDAVGSRMRLTGDTTWYTIVGVVRSIRDQDVAQVSIPHMYVPFAQAPDNWFSFVLRTDGNTAPVTSALRVIHQLESGIPLDGVRPLDDFVRQALDTRRLTETLLGAFAVIAALLATVGIYGVISLYVTNRTREFGIRMAVGADAARVVRLVLGEGAVLVVIGTLIGVAGAFIASRWLGSLLYDVSAHDPIVFTVFPLALGCVAITACYLPARRAARADPLDALRAE